MKKYYNSLVFGACLLPIGLWADWFGEVADYGGEWLDHPLHGWVYHDGEMDESVWVYMETLGWVWTGEGIYPFLYEGKDRNWLYFHRGTSPEDRWFYNFGVMGWQYGPKGNGYAPASIDFGMFVRQLEVTDLSLIEDMPADARLTVLEAGLNTLSLSVEGSEWVSGVKVTIRFDMDFTYEQDPNNGNVGHFEALVSYVGFSANGQSFGGTPQALAREVGEPMPTRAVAKATMQGYSQGTLEVTQYLTDGSRTVETETIERSIYEDFVKGIIW